MIFKICDSVCDTFYVYLTFSCVLLIRNACVWIALVYSLASPLFSFHWVIDEDPVVL